MRRMIIMMVNEVVALMVSLFLLETLGFMDFTADGAYSTELIMSRMHITMVLGGLLVIIPPLLKYMSIKKCLKANVPVHINEVVQSMLLSSIRGGFYYLVIFQWNAFALNEFIGHCSQ